MKILIWLVQGPYQKIVLQLKGIKKVLSKGGGGPTMTLFSLDDEGKEDQTIN